MPRSIQVGVPSGWFSVTKLMRLLAPGGSTWLAGGRSDHHEYAWSLPPLPDDGGGLPPGPRRAGRAAAVPASHRPGEPPCPRLRGPGQGPMGSALESPAALFGATWRVGRVAE